LDDDELEIKEDEAMARYEEIIRIENKVQSENDNKKEEEK
jgi:hypothetical protein